MRSTRGDPRLRDGRRDVEPVAGSRSSSVLTAETDRCFWRRGPERLRPGILCVRRGWSSARAVDRSGQRPHRIALVMVDDHPVGRIGALRDIQAYQIDGMRYYDVGEAGGKFGGRGASGVIEVRLKSPSRR